MAKEVKFGVKEQNALRAKFQTALKTLVVEGLELEVHVTTEGLVVRTENADVLFKVVVKKERVDFDAEQEELDAKAKEKADKLAKAEAKKAKDAQKRAEKAKKEDVAEAKATHVAMVESASGDGI